MPLVEITYSDWFDASLFEGVEIKALRSGPWTVGPLLKFDYTARPARDEAASGIGGIDRTIGIRGFAEYQFNSNLKFRTEVLESVHIQQGLSAKFALLYEARPLKALTLTIGPYLRWANRLWIDSGFSDGFELRPNPGQGAGPGPAGRFNPQSGLVGAGLEIAADYEWSSTTTISAFAEYERLSPQIARSPNVRDGGSRNQFYAGLSTSFKVFGK